MGLVGDTAVRRLTVGVVSSGGGTRLDGVGLGGLVDVDVSHLDGSLLRLELAALDVHAASLLGGEEEMAPHLVGRSGAVEVPHADALEVELLESNAIADAW